MSRVELPELQPKPPYVVPRADYEADKRRGYTVLEHEPERVMKVVNPRNPERSIERKVPAVLLFRCMRCKYDAADCTYTPDPDTKQTRTGLDLIKTHLERGVHPWSYTPFDNPYGNIEDVTIEGVEDYTKETT